MAALSDEQLIRQLASADRIEADTAVGEVMRRGPRLIGLLLKQRDNRQYFKGASLFNPRASILLPVPMEGFELPESQKDRVLTVEAAALYLISALYCGELNFSQAPLLFDITEPQAKRTVANTPERVRRAFDAAEEWYRSNSRVTTPQGKTDPNEPIAAANLRWY